MNLPDELNPELERRLAAGLLDVLIRAGLVLALVMLCYAIFSPFVSLMAWSMILAVTLYPAHQKLARRMGDGQGLAATLLVLAGIVVVVAPTSLLMGMMGDSVHNFVIRLQDHTLQIPAPWPSVAEVPIVGGKVHDLWTRAHADLPAFLQGIQPTIADLSLKVLAAVASLGGSALLFLFSFIIAGIIMAFGRSGARAMTAIFIRLSGSARGAELARLCTATIRAVALGVLGVALIQAIACGLVLLLASVPFAGVLTAIVLILGIAQIPALLITLPAIGYIWWSRNLRHRGSRHVHRAAARLRHARQRAEAAAARSRGRCADAGGPAGRAGRHGDQRHPGHVRRRDVPGAGLPDLHAVGLHRSGCAHRPGRVRDAGCD